MGVVDVVPVSPPSKDLEQVVGWLNQYWENADFDAGYAGLLRSAVSEMWPLDSGQSSPSFQMRMHTLPLYFCRAFGGSPELGMTINAAWSLLYAAFYLLDKVEDQETDLPIFSEHGIGVVNNLTTGLILVSQSILLQAAERAAVGDLQRAFHYLALNVCSGQHKDLSVSQPTLDQTWEIAGQKSGDFFGMACFTGALAARAAKGQADAAYTYGRCLGVMLQVNNDLHGMHAARGPDSDLARQKWTLPVAYAFHVLPPEQKEELLQLLASPDRENELKARDIILDCGVETYLQLETNRLCARAGSAVEQMKISLEHKDELLMVRDQFCHLPPVRSDGDAAG